MADEGASTSSTEGPRWSFGGAKVPRAEIVFFTQALIIFIVIVSCIYNLSKGDGEDGTLWSTLLASCLGYMLPAPKIKKYVWEITCHPSTTILEKPGVSPDQELCSRL
jgi:hypothetical protein